MFKAVLHWPKSSRTKTFETLPEARAAAVPRPAMRGTAVVRDAPCPTCGRLDLECDRCAPTNSVT
jgi:hypothetical protein